MSEFSVFRFKEKREIFMKKLFIILITVLLTNLVQAKEYAITATNEEDKETVAIAINTDVNFDIKDITLDYLRPNQGIVRTKTGTLEQANSNGILVRKQSGRNVVYLKVGSNFTLYQGGTVVIDYLYNAIKNHRRVMKLDLVRNADSWELEYRKRKVRKLHFVSNKKPFIGAIGIKRIRVVQ